MIWLVKTREKAIVDDVKGIYTYLKKCMEPAEKYIKKIKRTKITPEIKSNVDYHLYQLMELYVHCKIVAKWLSLETEEEKINFFYHCTDLEYIKEVCNFLTCCCSSFEYHSFSESIQNTINYFFNENLLDFKNAFEKCVDNIKKHKDNDTLIIINAISSMLSFYINQGAWTALRIVPTGLCSFEKIKFHGQKQYNYDYISSPIMSFDRKFKLQPIYNNYQFYELTAKESFIYFLTLVQKVYDSEI